MVERVLHRHGFEVGQNQRPYFISALPDYITQAELPRGNAFTWFTTMQPNSINTWMNQDQYSSFLAQILAYMAEQTAKGDEEDYEELEPKLDCVFNDSPLGFEKEMSEDFKMESQDPLEEVNMGSIENKKITYISKLLKRCLREEIIRILYEYRDCFAWDYEEMSGLDRSLVEHRLPMILGKKPVKQSPRRFSPQVIHKIKEEIERLLKTKFIRTSRYAEWISNIVPIIKKNGKLRVCIDFRDLNAATPKDEYPMPIAKTMIDAVTGNEMLSLLDGYSGYYQIYIATNDMSKTIFRCPGALGTHEWVIMPFGLKYAGATYQRAMNLIFHDLIGKFMQVYIDDIVIGSKKRDDHLQHLRLSFERMRKHGLKMNPLKCAFGVIVREFLGFIIHQKGIEVEKNIGKWGLALTEYSLVFVPLRAIKGQVIVDFLVYHSKLIEEVYYLTTKAWELFFDGSKHDLGTGIGLLIISPNGIPTKFSLRTKYGYSDNQVKYEALITRLNLLKELGAKNIIIWGDSQLVIKQVTREYKCTNEKLIECKSRMIALLNSFDEVQLEHISRNTNRIANELAQTASGYKISKECLESLVLVENELAYNQECLTVNTSTI
uniref:Transposon Ty3-G Gag-Pol polyprotein n=1 Tax=Cajanus cajan TaxID=3821 RepID=A0A151R7F8_CAJCA|nr:Transposon Ty3-G Gag-Pol polyprotein [Cajanus cajan]